MKLVVGLGNPGSKYENTRHNVGFRVIDELSQQLAIPVQKERFQSLLGEGRVGTEKVFLCKPLTFMNLSGQSVAQIRRFYGSLAPEDIIVAYDDMDFQPGQVKLRRQGSSGGHNGIKSLIESLGTMEFLRVRVGIGRPEPGANTISHVLGVFSPTDVDEVEKAVRLAAFSIRTALEKGFDAAMNQYNSQ